MILFIKIVLLDRVEVLVCMYSINFDYRIRIDIYADENEVMELLFIEIIYFYERNVVVGLIYRFLN